MSLHARAGARIQVKLNSISLTTISIDHQSKSKESNSLTFTFVLYFDPSFIVANKQKTPHRSISQKRGQPIRRRATTPVRSTSHYLFRNYRTGPRERKRRAVAHACASQSKSLQRWFVKQAFFHRKLVGIVASANIVATRNWIVVFNVSAVERALFGALFRHLIFAPETPQIDKQRSSWSFFCFFFFRNINNKSTY